MMARGAQPPVASWALRRLRRGGAAGLGAVAIALLLQCSIGHPVVGIWPREDRGDEPNWLALVLLGAASGALGPARPILLAAQNNANGGRLSLYACSATGDCTHTDISAGQAANSGITPVLRVNSVTRRLMVVTANTAAGSRPYLYNCALDGSNCSAADVSGGSGDVANPSFVLDTVNQKALISSQDTSQGQAASLWRCNFDGSGCQYLDLTWGAGGTSGLGADTAIDTINNRLVTVTNDGSVGQVPVLTWCAIDGTGCSRTNISGGAGATSGFLPSVLVEPNSAQLIVITEDGANGNRLGRFRSNLDGTGADYSQVMGLLQGGLSGQAPFALLDALNSKILVVTQNGANGNRVSLFRCDLDGQSNCTHTDISAGQPASSGIFPTAVIDSANQKLIVAAQNTANGDRVSIYRCNLDGSGCEHFDASAGQGASSGFRPWIALAP